MSEVLGIDVSHHNGKIDWAKVAGSGRKFVIMKAQYEAKSHRIDETFEYNYREAGKNGLARGVYVFIATDSINDPVADANALLSKLNGRTLEYGIWLDLESAALRKIGRAAITRLVYIYANLFRAAGYYVGIYCNYDWYYHVLDRVKLPQDFDFWIARYPKNDIGEYNPKSSLTSKSYSVAWQYSSKGKIPGVPTNCDLNVDFDGCVNLLAKGDTKKSIRQVALEVMDNKWGTQGTKPTRKELLEMAGYNYEEVRKVVNQLMNV